MEKAKCPTCKAVNDIVLTYADLSDDLRSILIVVKCGVCGRRLLTRRESEYVLCANCKSTVLVEKNYTGFVPEEYNNLTPMEYYLLLAKENSFNPYLFPVNSPYYLEPDFEKKASEQQESKEMLGSYYGEVKGNKLFGDGNEHLFQTVRSNQMNITTKYLNKK